MLNDICRLCVSDKDLLSIFAENSPKNLQTVVRMMTGVMISKTDIVSQKICANCIKLLGKMYEFRQLAQRTDRYLKKKYNSKNMLPSIENIIKPDNTNTKIDKTNSNIQGSSNIRTENISDQNEKLTIVNNDNVTNINIEPVTEKVKNNSKDGISYPSNLPANVTTESILKDNKSPDNIHSSKKLFRKDVPISNSIKNIFASYPNIKLHPVCLTLNWDPTVCMELNAVENYFLKNKLDIKEYIKLATKSARTKQFDNTVHKRKNETNTLKDSKINKKRKKICDETIEINPVQSAPSSVNNALTDNLLPHRCNICNSPKFSQKSLALHYKKHFKCIYCSKIFKIIEKKTIHEKSCQVKKVLESKPYVHLIKLEHMKIMTKKYVTHNCDDSSGNTANLIKSNLVNTESSVSPKSQELTIPPPTNIPQENSSIIKPAVFITDSSILNSRDITIDEHTALKLLFKKQCHSVVQTNNPFENIEIERNNRSAVFNNVVSYLVNSKIPVYMKTGDYNVKVTEINPQFPKQKQPWNTIKKIDFKNHKSSKLNSFSHYIRNGLPLLQTNTVKQNILKQSMEINRPTSSSSNNSRDVVPIILDQEKSQKMSKPVQIEDISQSSNVVLPQNKTQPNILFEKSLLPSDSGCFSGTNPELDLVVGTIQLNTKLNGNNFVQKSSTQNLPNISSQKEIPISTSLLVNKHQSSNETIIIPDSDSPKKVDVYKKFTNKYILIKPVLPNQIQKIPIANSTFGANPQIGIKMNNSNDTPLQSGTTVNNSNVTPLQSNSQVCSTTPISTTIVKNNKLIRKSVPQNLRVNEKLTLNNPNPFIINFTLPYHNLPSNNTVHNNYSISLPIKQPYNSLREEITPIDVNINKLDSNLPIPNNFGTSSTKSINMVPSSKFTQIPTTSTTSISIDDSSCSSISASTISTNIDTHNDDRPLIRVRNLCEMK